MINQALQKNWQQLRTPKLSLADAGIGGPLVTLSLLLRVFFLLFAASLNNIGLTKKENSQYISRNLLFSFHLLEGKSDHFRHLWKIPNPYCRHIPVYKVEHLLKVPWNYTFSIYHVCCYYDKNTCYKFFYLNILI